MNKLKVMIRADGGNEIGMGHLVRTGVIARVLSKYTEVSYICNETYQKGIGHLIDSGYTVYQIKEDGELGANANLQGDILITDHYGIDQEYMERVSNCFGETVYLDDNAEKVFRGTKIINQNYNAEKLDYSLTKNNGCKLFLGSNYTLLRDEFRRYPPIKIKNKVTDVLITVGGSDLSNITADVIREVGSLPYTFHVVIGPAFPFENKLKKDYSMPNVRYYHQPDMASLMNRMDIAISGCGSTMYELAVLGVPTIGIVVANNQQKTAKQLADDRLLILMGERGELDNKRLQTQLKTLAEDVRKRMYLHHQNIKVFNRDGVEEVVRIILNHKN